MNESVRKLELALTGLLDDARSLIVASEESETAAARFLDVVEQAETQLAATRLRLLAQAQFGPTGKVVDRVRNSVRTTRREANRSLRLGRELEGRFWILGQALASGEISEAQAEGIISGLRRLPESLGTGDIEHCQQHLLTFCDTLGPDELRIAATKVWELLDPDGADEIEEQRLKREERQARIGRDLSFSPDHHGSMKISGKLPLADAALLQSQLDALQPSAASYRDRGDESVPPVSARRADALVLLSQMAASFGELPTQGWDRPQLQITMPLSFLTDGAGRAGFFGWEGEHLTAHEARRLACDAGIIPMVLGSDSQPLDVGRESRLVTKPIRAALLQRDQGCAFPHCDTRPASCEAHHIQPWWSGGVTSIENLVLLCPFHHRLVEPDPEQSWESQWQVYIDEHTGMPLFRPPVHIDSARTPRLHRRHALARVPCAAPAQPLAQQSWTHGRASTRSARSTIGKATDHSTTDTPELVPISDPWHPDFIPPHRRLPAPVP